MNKKYSVRLFMMDFAIGSIVGILVSGAFIWYWEANHSDKGLCINIPQFIVGGGNTSYNIFIHKSQIRPYGTIWKTTYRNGWISSYPTCAPDWVNKLNEKLSETKVEIK